MTTKVPINFKLMRSYLIWNLDDFVNERKATQDLIIKLLFVCSFADSTIGTAKFFSVDYLKKIGTSKPTFLKTIRKYSLFVTDGKYKRKEMVKRYWLTDKSECIIFNYLNDIKNNPMITKPGIKQAKKLNSQDKKRIQTAPVLSFYDLLDAATEEEQKRENMQRAIELIQVLAIARDNNSTIPQEYKRLPCGRLVSTGLFSLQNLPSDIRKVAFSGNYNYDFINCHYTIAGQLAKRHYGISCPSINNYIKNPKEIRNQLVEDTSAKLSQVKTALLALLYGAKRRTDDFSSIHQEFKSNKEITQKFIGHKIVDGLSKDIKKLLPYLIKEGKQKYQFNGPNNYSIAAQVLMNYESQMLDAAIEGHSVLLPLFDGFVSSKDEDPKLISDRINNKTTMEVSVKKEQY